MRIAVVGASGNAGSRITAELARRGHTVTAIARNPDKIAVQANRLSDCLALTTLGAGDEGEEVIWTGDMDALLSEQGALPAFFCGSSAGAITASGSINSATASPASASVW